MSELRLPRLKRSLCGCSLETGSKVIGYFHLVILGLFSLAVLAEYIYMEVNPNRAKYLERDFQGVFIRDESFFTMVMSLLVFSAVFLVGIYKRNSILLEPFIVMKVVFLFMAFVHIGTFFVARVHGVKRFIIFPILANTALEGYILTVITSYKRQLENREL